MARCDMIPATPDSTAGFVTKAPGDVTIWAQFLMSPRLPSMAWLTPRVLVGVHPISLTFRADSSVSFTQRPALAAISEPAWAGEAAALNTAPARGDPIVARPSDATNRSTAVGVPTTASPSSSL